MIARYRDGRHPRGSPPAQPGTLEALSASVAERIDVFDITGALESIWERRPQR